MSAQVPTPPKPPRRPAVEAAKTAVQLTPPVAPTGPTGTAPTPRKKSRVRGIIFAVLLVMFACSVFLWVNYLTTHQPITDTLPVAKAAGQVIKPHYLFSIHGATQPLGIAVTPDGSRIYVGESGGQQMIHIYDRDGRELAHFTPPGNNSFSGIPNGISLDDEGRVFVADSGRNEIDIYDAGGNFKQAIKPVKEGWIPASVLVEGKSVLVPGRNGNTEGVLGLGLDGKLQFQFGHHDETGTADGFNDASKAVLDARGRLYVSDAQNARLAVFDVNRKFLYSLTGFSLPRGMAIDDDQKLYIVDTIDQMIKVYDVGGTDKPQHLFDFGNYGIGDGEFNYPNDIAFDTTGRLYITDRASNRVQVWAY